MFESKHFNNSVSNQKKKIYNGSFLQKQSKCWHNIKAEFNNLPILLLVFLDLAQTAGWKDVNTNYEFWKSPCSWDLCGRRPLNVDTPFLWQYHAPSLSSSDEVGRCFHFGWAAQESLHWCIPLRREVVLRGRKLP